VAPIGGSALSRTFVPRTLVIRVKKEQPCTLLGKSIISRGNCRTGCGSYTPGGSRPDVGYLQFFIALLLLLLLLLFLELSTISNERTRLYDGSGLTDEQLRQQHQPQQHR
jgi:hypothetical protein